MTLRVALKRSQRELIKFADWATHTCLLGTSSHVHAGAYWSHHLSGGMLRELTANMINNPRCAKATGPSEPGKRRPYVVGALRSPSSPMHDCALECVHTRRHKSTSCTPTTVYCCVEERKRRLRTREGNPAGLINTPTHGWCLSKNARYGIYLLRRTRPGHS